jgi:hypothetical protein
MAFFAEHWGWPVDAVLALPVSRRLRLVDRKLEALRKEQAEIDAIKSRGRK